MPREQKAGLTQSNVARLVDAERHWQQSLDAAREAAARRLAVARDDLRTAEAAARAEIASAVSLRSIELESTRREAVARVARDFAERVALYTSADDSLIDGIARSISSSAPWFSAAASP